MNAPSHAAEIATNYVNGTNRHIFLTGKAGTGKTTFLRQIVRNTYKNAVVAAPTGIAAINAEGVTLHSLLQLPFGVFIPDNVPFHERSIQVTTPNTLFKDARFSTQKRKLLNELELLIIDEVSMLRADLLDCMDATLRAIRKKRFDPFGGVQILFIGDLMQLPPVVRNNESTILNQYYPSPYFFEAHALKENPPIRVELDKVYRQSDDYFIGLLNRLRHNELSHEDLTVLNGKYLPESEIQGEGYIHLTTHNAKADKINASRLLELPTELMTFNADVEGDFPDHLFPNEKGLKLKEGAQVMFIKNDPTGQGKFFNGKIGTISSLEEDILVTFDESEEVKVEQYEWENARYVLEKSSNEIDKKVIGTFKQYPLRLAWAVTIHKSQGLTFERAILDLEDTFAAGQLYVALSRLTSLNGLIMSSLLPESTPSIDDQLKTYISSFEDKTQLEKAYEQDRIQFLATQAERAFLFDSLLQELAAHKRTFNKDENRSLKQKNLPWTDALINDTFPLKAVGEGFIKQVNGLLADRNLEMLAQRMAKATVYFDDQLSTLLDRIKKQYRLLKTQTQAKNYRAELLEIKELYTRQLKFIIKLNLLIQHMNEGVPLTKQALQKNKQIAILKEASKKDKVPTAEISYQMHKEGKSIKVIAAERGLVEGTIEGHLASFVKKGKLDVTKLIKPSRLKTILKCYDEGLQKASEIKPVVPDSYTWGEIRLAIAHAERTSSNGE